MSCLYCNSPYQSTSPLTRSQSVPVDIHLRLGTPGFYRQFEDEYPWGDLIDRPTVLSRKTGKAARKKVHPLDLTNDDLVVWFSRKNDAFTTCGHKNVRYDPNSAFNPKRPVGYQQSRVQLGYKGEVIEHTRQVLCMFCQTATYFPLWGQDCLILHFEDAHVREVPRFVKILLRELGLSVYPPDLTAEEQSMISDTLENGKRRVMSFEMQRGHSYKRAVPLSRITEKMVRPIWNTDSPFLRQFLAQHKQQLEGNYKIFHSYG